jgi:hypothetical protein
VSFTRSGYPAQMVITDQDENPAYFIVYLGSTFALPNSYNYLGNRSINSGGDETSFEGDLASIWTTAHDAFAALEAEGEIRHRKEFGSANFYDLITYRFYNVASYGGFAVCNDSYIAVDDDQARTDTTAHETGHIYHGRVVGCSANKPAFPEYYDGAGGWSTSESNSLGEAIASWVALLARWDPATASTVDIYSDWAPCATDLSDPAFYDDTSDPDDHHYDNNNDASAHRNNYMALWEFIDTDTGNTDAWSDSFDETMDTVMDALVTLQNTPGTQGQNRTADEMYQVNTYNYCDHTAHCAAGQVCINSYCRSGDPHGGNIRDWVYHLAANLSRSDTDAWRTLVSSPCIGDADDSYPFRGGYFMY